MSVTASDIMAILDQIAPRELSESYDNVGLLAGHPSQSVERVLVALDLTESVVHEAEKAGAQMIVTHHPIFFRGRKNIREDDAEGAAVCALFRAHLAMAAAHTNFDNAYPGVNDALSEALGLENVETAPHGMRAGSLSAAMTVMEFVDYVEKKLNTRARVYAARDKRIERVAVLGGAGGDFFDEALSLGADAYVTGEVRHHDALAACAQGLCLIEAGHCETERVCVKLLAACLQNRCDELQYNVTVVESREMPFMR